MTGLLQSSPRGPFSLCRFCSVSFVRINLSHGCDSMLSLFGESQNLGGGLGDPGQTWPRAFLSQEKTFPQGLVALMRLQTPE